ncbi:hypothetical protein B0J15DRAFT_235661 [Fusarium solani]|uniref:Uncharacterized protein n=1 Tax=Fusarium solani TaxID=169388 RepID=A0A9P9HXS6_FUSSL|nr:uncharacterized protein B0J15DRAFT_235661 [Fusarium solani]KAH7265893.1 hypothetical protein B0J15DRAFT_235661 [Fusarium solani]
MDRWCRIVPFIVLAFQALILTTTAQASDGEEIAYAEDGSTYRTLRCDTSETYISSTTYSDDEKTYGFCDIGGDGYHQVHTSCRGSTIYYTGWTSDGANPYGSYICPTGSCVTATIYTSYSKGFISSRAYHIYCNTREPMSRYFMERPSDWSDEPITVTVPDSQPTFPGATVFSATSTDDSDSASQTDDTRLSLIAKGGPSSGVIAGAVVGALAGIALIACALIIGFRMGRRHPRLDNQESGPKKSFRDTISSFPRPAIGWSRPNAKETPKNDLQNDVSVLQVNFSDDATAKRASELPSPAQSPVNQVQSIPPPISPQPYSTDAVESHRVELPTGLESQGWARSDAHPLPYEVDAQPQTHEVDGTPNNRTSSP